MKRCGLLVKLAFLICAVITVVSASHTSLAYMAANSNAVHNFFRVEYLPPQDVSVPVVIQKSMVNLAGKEIGPGGFEFRLINADTGEALTATSADNGLATMVLTFTADDAGKTYRYQLYELNTGRENVTYDETVYEISVSLVLNEINEMTARLTVDGQPVTEIVVEFENEYCVTTSLPDTGDHAHLLLWTIMLIVSGTGLVLLGKNRIIFRRM